VGIKAYHIKKTFPVLGRRRREGMTRTIITILSDFAEWISRGFNSPPKISKEAEATRQSIAAERLWSAADPEVEVLLPRFIQNLDDFDDFSEATTEEIGSEPDLYETETAWNSLEKSTVYSHNSDDNDWY
jgi:hypothetical protein